MTASPAQVDVSCPASRVMDAPTISCLECNQRLEKAYLGMATTPWQVAAFENHTPKPVALNELTTGGEEKFVATLAPAEALYFFSRMGAVWRARDEEGEMLLEHRVGPHFLIDDGMGVDFGALQHYPDWVPNRGPADNEGASPRFPRTMINASPQQLEVYARMENGKEVKQADLGPREAFNVVTTWGRTFVARRAGNGAIVAELTMHKVAVKPCKERSDGARVVHDAHRAHVDEPIIAPYARPTKSAAQLKELALKVELTNNESRGPGRRKRSGGVHQWAGEPVIMNASF